MAVFFACRALNGQSGHDVAWALLAQLYDAHVGAVMPEIRREKLGKPYFATGSWHFSLTHSDRHAACVLADCPVGIDAEELGRHIAPSLAKKVLSPSEKAQFDAAKDPNRALLTFWVLKEALGKCSGQGVNYPLNQTDFMLTDSRVFEQDGCLIAIITEEEEPHAI